MEESFAQGLNRLPTKPAFFGALPKGSSQTREQQPRVEARDRLALNRSDRTISGPDICRCA